ncbi:MAG TPA: hypothetical protein ENO14_01420 [Chromatiales bacterium]|nr:hypothetical protein [Chromatiales bacterium]
MLGSDDLTDRIYADATIRAALERAAHARREPAPVARVPWWRRRVVQWLAPAIAVAAVVVVVVVQHQSPELPPVFRGSNDAALAIEPQGDIAAPPARFVWHSLPSAASFRFELFDASQPAPVFSATTTDTVVLLPTGIAPPRGYWKITPLDDVGVGTTSGTLTHYVVVE